MGHQLTFYLTPADMRVLESKLRGLGPMVVLHSDSTTQTPRIVNSLEFYEEGQPWRQLYLARPEDLGLIDMRAVPARSLWYVGVLDSPVVEFCCCFFNGKILRDGRVYWTDHLYAPDGSRVLKGVEFRAWAAKIRSTVKKFLKPFDGKLIGPDTALWLERSGGRLLMPHEDAE